jgi:hypothetical protein
MYVEMPDSHGWKGRCLLRVGLFLRGRTWLRVGMLAGSALLLWGCTAAPVKTDAAVEEGKTSEAASDGSVAPRMTLFVFQDGAPKAKNDSTVVPRKGYFVEFALAKDAGANEKKPQTVIYQD